MCKYNLNQFPQIQNSAAHRVVNASIYNHITQVLQKLDWLQVDQSVQFRVLLTTYKAVNGEAPEYLCDLMSIRHPSRALRSSS